MNNTKAFISAAVPLCVDLDGTLIRSDLLLESFLALIKGNPFYLLLVPFWLLGGKANLKAQIARRISLDPAHLPYQAEFLDWLKQERAKGRSLWLCTASHETLAREVARHLGIFDGVMASDGETNLSGRSKGSRLAEQFGEGGFDYCGNARVDLAVWGKARSAVVVNGVPGLRKAAEKEAPVTATFDSPRRLLRSTLKALRPHQWAKNILVFIPLLAGHRIQDAAAVWGSLMAFLAFSLCASSVYLLNDMLDLAADRQHPRKCRRPFASGELSLLVGFGLAPLFLLAGGWLAFLLPDRFVGALLVYYVLTLAYSLDLKRRVLVDTLSLAGLYTIRIIAGALAIGVTLSFWLLLFSIFLFLSLALVKRFTELEALRAAGGLSAAGRGYHVEDLPVLRNLGTSAGYLSVLVLALYINTPAVTLLYRQPEWIWGLCVLMLYWISRIWLKAHRGEMHEDPVVFALRDRGSLFLGVLSALVVWIAV